MKENKTLMLKGSLIVIAAFILFLCVLLFPVFLHEDNEDYLGIVIGLYLAALPFYFALFQAWKLLSLIDRSQAFTQAAVSILRKIKYSALIITGLFVLYTPMFMAQAQKEDAPGLFAINLMIIFLSSVITLFGGLLEKLFQNAVDIKSENELTV